MARTARALGAAGPGAAAEVVDRRVCRGGGSQDVDYVEVLRLTRKVTGLHTLRVRIRSNAYAAQSFARVERWDGSQWHPLHELGNGNMATPPGLYVHGDGGAALEARFARDRDELVRLATGILS